jgi:predicted RNase H-like HicB family nuclease
MEQDHRDPPPGEEETPESGAIERGSRYRVIITASGADDQVEYIARVAELPTCEARGTTRSDALAQLESALVDELAKRQAEGARVPPAFDLQRFDGQLALRVSPELHRELAFTAELAELDLASLVQEILARTVHAEGRERGRSGASGRGSGARRRRGNMDDKRYHGIMENRADFIEYVRQLERDGGSGGGGRGRGGRGRR